MRVGLDLDGLLDERPDFFAFLTAALRTAGHFVAVLTYRDPATRAKTESQLRGWGIGYDELHFALYGDKYRAGLVRGPASPVFVSRGLGEAGVPVRYDCPPETNLLTLTAGPGSGRA